MLPKVFRGRTTCRINVIVGRRRVSESSHTRGLPYSVTASLRRVCAGCYPKHANHIQQSDYCEDLRHQSIICFQPHCYIYKYLRWNLVYIFSFAFFFFLSFSFFGSMSRPLPYLVYHAQCVSTHLVYHKKRKTGKTPGIINLTK